MKDSDPYRSIYLQRLWVGVALLALLMIPAIVHSHAAIESLFNRPADWVPDSLPEKADFNEFVEHFSAVEMIMVAWDGAELDSEDLRVAGLILQPLCTETSANWYPQDTQEKNPNVEVDELPPWARRWVADTRRVCETETPLNWARTGHDSLSRMMASPANIPRKTAIHRLQGTLIGPDEKQTCMMLSLSEPGLSKRRILIPAIRQMIGKLAGIRPQDVAVVGSPFEGAAVDAESIRSIQRFSPPSAIIAAILCFLCLRSVPMTLAIVVVAVIGEGLVLAAVYYTGTPMNAILIVLPPLVFVLTVSAGIHLSNYYLDIANEFPDLSLGQAARGAMRAGVAPCSLATGTTVIGMLSLCLVRLQPVRIFGFVASLGVVVTLCLLFLVLPGAMVLTNPRHRKGDAGGQDAGRKDAGSNGKNGEPTGLRNQLLIWFRKRFARPWPMIAAFLLISLILSLGLGRLESSVNVPRMFLPQSDIRTQYKWFERHVGPTVTGELLLTFPAMSDRDDPLVRLTDVAKVQRSIIKLPMVGGTVSAMTFVPSIPRGKNVRATAARSIIRKLIRDPHSSLRHLGFIAENETQQIWRISIRMPQDKSANIGQQIHTVKQTAIDAVSDSALRPKVTLTGSVSIVQKSQEILLRDLFRSFVTAFGIIAIVMIGMLRSIVGGLLAMIPNLFPTVVLFGLMGLIRLPLDIGSVMSASVALGIAVDDTVHLLSRYGSRRARGIGQIRAAYGALSQCGVAMVQTTIVCGVSLMAYWFSDFVPTSRFSLLMLGLLTFALLGVTFLLPAMMCSFMGKWLARTIGSDPKASIFSDKPDDTRRLPTHHE